MFNFGILVFSWTANHIEIECEKFDDILIISPTNNICIVYIALKKDTDRYEKTKLFLHLQEIYRR